MNDDDDKPEANDTALGLLRKLEDGDFVNHCGAEVQALLKTMRNAAGKRGRVTGKVTIEVKLAMGKDGYVQAVPSIACKAPKAPARLESTMYIDEDGDINGKPVEKQMSFKAVEGGKGKDVAAPAAKSM